MTLDVANLTPPLGAIKGNRSISTRAPRELGAEQRFPRNAGRELASNTNEANFELGGSHGRRLGNETEVSSLADVIRRPPPDADPTRNRGFGAGPWRSGLGRRGRRRRARGQHTRRKRRCKKADNLLWTFGLSVAGFGTVKARSRSPSWASSSGSGCKRATDPSVEVVAPRALCKSSDCVPRARALSWRDSAGAASRSRHRTRVRLSISHSRLVSCLTRMSSRQMPAQSPVAASIAAVTHIVLLASRYGNAKSFRAETHERLRERSNSCGDFLHS